MSDLNVEILTKKFFPDYGTGSIVSSLQQIYIVFLISVPLSLLLFIMFTKYRHYLLVDLGHHKWLIK
jgi:hypothetical protein